MGQTADRLRQEVEHKREDAAAKIDQIEARVQDIPQMAKDAATETVQQAKQSFDLRRQVEERPLVALGAALVGGFLLGGIMGGDGQGGQQQPQGRGRPQAGRQAGGQQGGLRGRIRDAAKSSGLEETVASITAAAMGLATDKLRATVDQSFPGFAEKMQAAQQAGGDLARRQEAARQADSSAGQTDAPGRTAPYRSLGAATGSTGHG